MAPSTAPVLVPPLRGSLTVVGGRKPDQRTETAELRMELQSAGQEMKAMGARIEFAIQADRPDVALQVAGRLQVLGCQYADPDSDTAA